MLSWAGDVSPSVVGVIVYNSRSICRIVHHAIQLDFLENDCPKESSVSELLVYDYKCVCLQVNFFGTVRWYNYFDMPNSR